jgi:hypothetical protein
VKTVDIVDNSKPSLNQILKNQYLKLKYPEEYPPPFL